jgi:hypothetical protein
VQSNGAINWCNQMVQSNGTIVYQNTRATHE